MSYREVSVEPAQNPLRVSYLHYLQKSDTAMSHVRSFSDAATELGHDVVVRPLNVHFENVSNDGNEPKPGVASKLKDPLRRFLHEPKELLWNVRYARREAAAIQQARPDVLLVRDHSLTASCVWTARRTRLPLVIEFNAPALESKLFLSQYWHVPGAARFLERLKLSRADRCIVVSSALRDHLSELHGVPKDKIGVVPNGADPELFSGETAASRSIPENIRSGVVVGFVGSFQAWHGTDLLSEMTLSLGRRHPEVRFLFVGDGPERQRVAERLSELSDRVHFTGSVPHDEVAGFVAAFDVGVVSDAGFYMSPLKVFEWMAAEVAVVAPRLGPLEEVIQDGAEGLLFEPGNAEDLSRAVEQIVVDQEKRRSLGASARRRIVESLTWRHNAARVLELCAEAVEENRGR